MATASTRLPLAAWYVISLRPCGEHARVRRAARRLGARVFALSPQRIEPLPASAALMQALAADTVVVTSPNAVKAAVAMQPLASRATQGWLAVGEATAAALRRAGIAEVQTPDRQDSEGLLALAALQTIRGQHIGLITAPGGRDLLSNELARRGAVVSRAEVYRRHAIALPAARLQRLSSLPLRSALLVSSEEALKLLWQALNDRQRTELRLRPAVASSARLTARLREHGFDTVLTAASAAPLQLLRRLAEHAAKQPLPVG